jgi:DNA adenine methylase
MVPKEYKTYIEPFVGGGAFLFALQPKKAIINDNNIELMETYKVFNSKKELLSLRERERERETTRFQNYSN